MSELFFSFQERLCETDIRKIYIFYSYLEEDGEEGAGDLFKMTLPIIHTNDKPDFTLPPRRAIYENNEQNLGLNRNMCKKMTQLFEEIDMSPIFKKSKFTALIGHSTYVVNFNSMSYGAFDVRVKWHSLNLDNSPFKSLIDEIKTLLD